MKYNQIILESLQKVTLKKVRIKVDPINVSQSNDLSNCNGYEGYVLAEDQDFTKVLVIQPDQDGDMSVMNIPNEHLEKLANINENLTSLKEFIILALNLSVDDPLIQQLQAAESINDVEVFLKDRGMSDDDIVELYKYYIANE
jgi:hypothetical protein